MIPQLLNAAPFVEILEKAIDIDIADLIRQCIEKGTKAEETSSPAVRLPKRAEWNIVFMLLANCSNFHQCLNLHMKSQVT